MRVRDLLVRDLVAVDADSPLHLIAEKMKVEDVGMIPVLSNGRIVGIVTDRDLVLRVLAPISEPAMMTAWDVMSRDPICIDEETTLDRAAEVMRDRRLRRLVVTRHDGSPLGVVSVSDLCRFSDTGDRRHENSLAQAEHRSVSRETGGEPHPADALSCRRRKDRGPRRDPWPKLLGISRPGA